MGVRLRLDFASVFAALMIVVMGVWLPSIAHAEGDEEESRGDLALTGDAICTRCHDEYEYLPILSIGKTKHGTRADERTPACTSCHGDSQEHLDGSESDDGRPLTEIKYGVKSPTPIVQRNQACLSCHQGGERIHWQQGQHNLNDVACTSCHQVHTDHDKVRERTTQAEVCFSCHKQQRMDALKFSAHPLEEGKVVCSDCHTSHGSAGVKELARDTVVDTCYQCHAEKRGPFIWSHEPVNEDCSFCHNSHGSNISGMLKTRMPMLCQNCHEGDVHRGLPPDENSRFTTGRACANCHTNIHGSNSPSGTAGARSLQR